VKQRPGFCLARNDDVYVAVGNGAFHLSFQILGGPIWKDDAHFLEPWEVEQISEGASFSVRSRVTIFETPYSRGHLWAATARGHRVVWEGYIEGTHRGREWAP
jgi:hypothetical protein